MPSAHRPGTASAMRRRPGAVPVGAVLGLAVFAGWIATSTGGVAITRYVDDVGTVTAAAIAAVSCGVAARSHTGPVRRFWWLLSAGLCAWTFGEAAWAVYDLGLGGNVPVPSFADIGYLGAIPLTVAALLVRPGSHNRARLRTTIDALIVATSLLFLSWALVLGSVWRTSDLTRSAGLVAVAYPFGDVVIVFLLIRAVRWVQGPDRIAFACILVGLLAMALSDSAYTYLTAVRGYETGNLIDIGWVAGYLGIAVGAWYGRRPAAPVREVSATTQTVTTLLPYLPIFLALAVLTTRTQLDQSIDTTSLLLAFVLTGSVLLRQLLVGIQSVRPVTGSRR